MWLAKKLRSLEKEIIFGLLFLLLFFCLLPFTVSALKPEGLLLKFLTDPGFWGNIIATVATLMVLVYSLRESKKARLVSLMLNDINKTQDKISECDAHITTIQAILAACRSYTEGIDVDERQQKLALHTMKKMAETLKPLGSLDGHIGASLTVLFDVIRPIALGIRLEPITKETHQYVFIVVKQCDTLLESIRGWRRRYSERLLDYEKKSGLAPE